MTPQTTESGESSKDRPTNPSRPIPSQTTPSSGGEPTAGQIHHQTLEARDQILRQQAQAAGLILTILPYPDQGQPATILCLPFPLADSPHTTFLAIVAGTHTAYTLTLPLANNQLSDRLANLPTDVVVGRSLTPQSLQAGLRTAWSTEATLGPDTPIIAEDVSPNLQRLIDQLQITS